MPEQQDRGVAEAAAVKNTGMAFGVDQNVIILAGNRGKETDIRLIPGREDNGAALAVELRDLLFEVLMQVIAAVGDTRSGRTGAIRGQRVRRGLDSGIVEGQAKIIVRTQQDAGAVPRPSLPSGR